MKRILALALLPILVVLVVAASARAADLPVSVVSLSSPVAAGDDATLRIRTAPGATCDITVLYKSGPSKARGLVPTVADAKGFAAWRWRVGSSTTPGRWPISVNCTRRSERGVLQTDFQVR